MAADTVISAAAVREALHAIRYGRSLRASPLIHLALVTARLRQEGLGETPESRAWALGQVIEATVCGELAALRGERPSPERPVRSPDAERRLLEADLASGQIAREAWGLLHHRYLAAGQPAMRDVIERTGVPKRTVAARVTRACASLANVLQSAEVEANRLLRPPPADAVDRIIVDEASAPRRAVDVLGDLQAVLRSSQRSVRVSSGQLEAAANHPSADLASYRLGRIAEWSQPRYRLDSRFVSLSLLTDMGEESPAGRWQPQERRFADLRDVLAAMLEPAVIVLGPPGSGKSTLLRRLELDLAVEALAAGDDGAAAPVTFLASLNQYRAAAPGGPLPDPRSWLAERWTTRFPNLPPLAELLAAGRIVLLLDGLNEMPHRDQEDYRQGVLAWKLFLHDHVAAVPGNRVVVACRSLDYSAPLSTPRLRVPQVLLEPLTDDQVRAFLDRYRPGHAEALWTAISGQAMLEAVRWPFFLRLLVEQSDVDGTTEGGLATLFTAFVRRALMREVERDNPLFAPGALVTVRDCARLAGASRWRTPWELPADGVLFPSLSRLAHAMQSRAALEEMSQVRIPLEAARTILGECHGADIVGAGVALGILEEDRATGDVLFRHQLFQEFFAAHELAARSAPEPVVVPWRTADIQPGLRELLHTLPPGETLPALPTTGWEETMCLAASMVESPEAFVRAMMPLHLAGAGRAAGEASVRARLSPTFLDELRWALVSRSRDPAADLRDRIACGHAAGDLGDPRFVRRSGPHGPFVTPPTVEIPGGAYPIGGDEPVNWDTITTTAHMPAHAVTLEPFSIGRFPVTNAEYRCFVEAGGYEDERWWASDVARAWRLGIGTAAGVHVTVRYWLATFRERPELLEERYALGGLDDVAYVRWQRRLAMTADELEAHLWELYPNRRYTEPRYWSDVRFGRPTQPVVGITVYDAQAYCTWLAAQTDTPYRLPTEVEWEAAARGQSARVHGWGNTFDCLRSNTMETRLRCPTPVGVFVEGDTPEGIADMSGNVAQWTSSLFGDSGDEAEYAYPYRSDDGREGFSLNPDVYRVARGGAWNDDRRKALATVRRNAKSSLRGYGLGFRVAASAPPP